MSATPLPPRFADVLAGLGRRARELRLLAELQQKELAVRAGVSLATVRRFEKTGRASVENVLRLASALRADAGFDRLFELPRYGSLDEALERPTRLTRQRVRKKAP